MSIVQRSTRHIIPVGHFGEKSFQAIDFAGTGVGGGHVNNSNRNICTCTQIWTILSVLTKTKPNPITFLKFLELIGKMYRMKGVQSTNCDCAYCPSYYPWSGGLY